MLVILSDIHLGFMGSDTKSFMFQSMREVSHVSYKLQTLYFECKSRINIILWTFLSFSMEFSNINLRL